MIQSFSMVMVLGLTFHFSAFAAVKKAEPLKVDAKSEVILALDGKIFPQDTFPSNCKDFLKGVKCNAESYGRAHIESRKEKDGMVYSTSIFTGPEGDQQIEQSWEKDGHVQKAIIENKILGKLMQVEVKNGRAYFQVIDQKNKNKIEKSDEVAEENLVVPSTIMNYIKPHSEKIAKGEKIQIKIAVLERLGSYTFNIKKVRDEKTIDGEAAQVLEMAPASIFVKAVVSPMYFHIKTKTGEMFAFEGESAVRRKVGGDWKKMQVFTSYDYKVNASLASGKTDCDPTAMLTGKSSMKCEAKQ
jgi:hypothetical protein